MIAVIVLFVVGIIDVMVGHIWLGAFMITASIIAGALVLYANKKDDDL